MYDGINVVCVGLYVALTSAFSSFNSVYWDYAMTIRLEEIVYLHCHQQGKIIRGKLTACSLCICLNNPSSQLEYFPCLQWTVVALWCWWARMGSRGLHSVFQKEAICCSSSRVWRQDSFHMASLILLSGLNGERWAWKSTNLSLVNS